MFEEDLFIKNYFKDLSKGFYADVGCYHPLEGNNTYLLYKKGWRGVNFDINSYSINLFNFFRKRDLNIHSGISNKKNKMMMYYRKKINMLNTVNSNHAKKYFRNGFKKKIVKVNTLNYFIEKNFKTLKKIDFLNIDVEGNELNVLRALNFTRYKPQLLCIEIHDKLDKHNKIYNYLIYKKYKVVWNKKYSYIFERKI
jgi:FkbM family methyltransferase